MYHFITLFNKIFLLVNVILLHSCEHIFQILDMKSLGRGESQSLIDAYRGITGNNIETENDQYSLKKLERLIKNRL